MDETEVMIQIEDCDSDDLDEMLAQIKKELTTDSAPVPPEKENTELSVCIKSEKDESDSPYNTIETIDLDDDSPSVVSQTVDNFIIYEIDQDNYKNHVPSMLEVPQSAEFEANRKPAKEINESNDIMKTTNPMDKPPSETNDIAVNDVQDIISLESSDEDEVSVLNGYPIRKSNADTAAASNSKNAESKKRKLTDVKAREKIAKISLSNPDDTVRKYPLHLSTDVFTQLELKDFFERVFEETRKLSMKRRQIIKMVLLKAVCKAEEGVEAEQFCETCYEAKKKAVMWTHELYVTD